MKVATVIDSRFTLGDLDSRQIQILNVLDIPLGSATRRWASQIASLQLTQVMPYASNLGLFLWYQNGVSDWKIWLEHV